MIKKIIVVNLILIMLLIACMDKMTDNPRPNQPPETSLTFYTDSTLATTTSRQVLHWWGDDPDGKVISFIYTWDTQAAVPEVLDQNLNTGVWSITTAYSDTFSLKFTGLDTTYTFRISAVDDQGLVDPTPAQQVFPMANSAPEIEFVVGTDIPETTFTVASFYWKGTDLDGDETIERYEYVLNDTNQTWQSIASTNTSLNLLIQDAEADQDHVFYVRAVDIAGVTSPIIRMPQKESKIWHVKKPKGDILIIDDFEVVDRKEKLHYKTLDSLGLEYSRWDIKLNRDGDNNYDLMPNSMEMFSETLLLFKRVIWYSDSDVNNLQFQAAQIAIPKFLETDGNKIIFSIKLGEFFSDQGDPLDFSPVDSLAKKQFDLLPGMLLEPSAEKPYLPKLKSAAWIPFVKELVPKISAKVFYRLQENPALWEGQPVIAVENAENSFIFFGVPFHQLDGFGNCKKLLAIILNDEFGAP